MAGLTILDIITALLVGGGLAFGFFRGFVCEVLSLFAWVAAVIVLKFLHEPISEWLADKIGSPTGAAVIAFVILFGGALVAGKMVASRLGRATRQSAVGPVDRLLGAGFGALKGLIGVTLLYLAFNLGYDLFYGQLAERPHWVSGARSYPLLHASGRAIVDFVEAQRNAAEAEARDEDVEARKEKAERAR